MVLDYLFTHHGNIQDINALSIYISLIINSMANNLEKCIKLNNIDLIDLLALYMMK